MNVVRIRKWTFGFSGILVLISIVALSIPPALTPGIDFSGGAAFNLEFQDSVTPQAVETALNAIGHNEAVIQPSLEDGGNFGRTYFIRMGKLEPTPRDADGNIITPGDREEVEEALGALSPISVIGFDTVSGIIAAENVRNAVTAVIVAAVVILFYVTWAFRRVPSPFRYGMSAIFALVHDVLIVIGLFSILGKTIDLEINAMFITGVLTVIGYSVNDTIVVFDRVRENIVRFPASTITEIVNLSVRETVGRSLNTSITLLVVILALILFASTSIQPLLFVLAAGVVVGTYSSIFIATLTLVAWENGEIRGFFSRIPIIGPKRRVA
jgi:preprotein translocase subunit SecF